MQRRLDSVNTRLALRDAPVRFICALCGALRDTGGAVVAVAHYLVTVQFNVSPLYLRLASFAIPLPFGMAAYVVSKIGVRSAFGLGALIAFLSVSGMLTVIGIIDNVPIVPPTFLEWRESFEYGLSIALAFLTGNILAMLVFVVLPSTIASGGKPSAGAFRIARIARPACRRRGTAPPRAAHPGPDADGRPAGRRRRDRGRFGLYRPQGHYRGLIMRARPLAGAYRDHRSSLDRPNDWIRAATCL